MSEPAPSVPYAVAARSLLRDTLLDAVGDLLRNRSWAQVTMAEVASRAGVSRQTLYNELRSRDDLARAYIMREADRFLDAVEQAVVANRDDPREAVTKAYAVFLQAAADHPLLRAIARGEGGDQLLALIAGDEQPILTIAAHRLAEVFAASWPAVSPQDAELVAQSIARLLGPYLDQILG